MSESKNMNWKTIASDYLFKDQWFTVRRDSCERPDGKIVSPYYVYEFPTWVTALAFTKDGKIVMERQYRHAIGETSFELPGGCVDDTDPDNQTAIARELEEETGYQFEEYIYLGKTCCNTSTNSNWMHMYIAKGGELKKDQSLDDNEDIEVLLLELDELKDLVKRGEIIQSMHITTIFYAFNHLGIQL